MNRQQSFLPTVDADVRENWRMDSQASFARFAFYPYVRNGETGYLYQESLEIKPYPNPLSFGGMWGSGGVKTREELERVKTDFFKSARRYAKHGLTRFEEEEGATQDFDANKQKALKL